VPLRCLGEGLLSLPGEGHGLIGVTRLEIMDGNTHVAFCMLSLTLKRAPDYRLCKARFADDPQDEGHTPVKGKTPPLSHTTSPSQRSPAAPPATPTTATKQPSAPATTQATPTRTTPASSTGILKSPEGGILKSPLSRAVSPPAADLGAASPSPKKEKMLVTPASRSGSVLVECVRTYSDPHNGHTVYVFKCSSAAYCPDWEIRRRFRDFQMLHTRLGKAVQGHPELELPVKRFFGSNSESVVAERRQGLADYLNNLVILHDPADVPSIRGPAEVPSVGATGDIGSSCQPSAVVAAFLQMPSTT